MRREDQEADHQTNLRKDSQMRGDDENDFEGLENELGCILVRGEVYSLENEIGDE